MKIKTMYTDGLNRPWDTAEEARASDERMTAQKIIGDFAVLENNMRERLLDQQPMMSLEDVIMRIRHIYENRIPVEEPKGDANVGHDGPVDGADANGDAGSADAGSEKAG